jgi:hypothetical protein
MNVEISWLAILLATVISMILAKSWYSQSAFGGAWRKLTGVTPADSKKAGKKPIVITLFANIITVYVLAVIISISTAFFKSGSIWIALLTGFLIWLAFSVTTLATHNAFEQKSLKLTVINSGYQLVLFLAIAAIIGWIGV